MLIEQKLGINPSISWQKHNHLKMIRSICNFSYVVQSSVKQEEWVNGKVMVPFKQEIFCTEVKKKGHTAKY